MRDPADCLEAVVGVTKSVGALTTAAATSGQLDHLYLKKEKTFQVRLGDLKNFSAKLIIKEASRCSTRGNKMMKYMS